MNDLLMQFWQKAVEHAVDKNFSRVCKIHISLLDNGKDLRNLMNQQLKRRKLEETLDFIEELILLLKSCFGFLQSLFELLLLFGFFSGLLALLFSLFGSLIGFSVDLSST